MTRFSETTPIEEQRTPPIFNVFMLLLWLIAAVTVFLPFAKNTSPLDTLLLRVPGNQGNWWHVLIGAPFFLAFPMVWLRLRSFFSRQPFASTERRVLWIVIVLCMCGTTLVEVPFLLHRAGTSEAQRLFVIATGLGTIIASTTLLVRLRQTILPAHALLVGLNAAYLANLALCLIVYSEDHGPVPLRLGWVITIVIVWPIALELVWIFTQTLRTAARASSLRNAS